MSTVRTAVSALVLILFGALAGIQDAAGQQARTGCFRLEGPEDGPPVPERIQIVIHDPHGGTGDFERHRTALAGGFVVDGDRLHVVLVHEGVDYTAIFESDRSGLVGRLLRVGERRPPTPEAWRLRAIPEPCRPGR